MLPIQNFLMNMSAFIGVQAQSFINPFWCSKNEWNHPLKWLQLQMISFVQPIVQASVYHDLRQESRIFHFSQAYT